MSTLDPEAAPPRPRPTARRALPRFLAVGMGGVVVNMTVVWLLHGVLGVPLLLSGTLATETAIIGNYAGNELFTFHLRKLHLGRLLRFNAIALGGLGLTVATLWLLQHVADWHYLLDNVVAIGAGSSWNFAANFGWTWGKATAREDRSLPAAHVPPRQLPASAPPATRQPRPGLQSRAMGLVDQLQADLTTAMKARDAETTATLRMVMAAVKNARVAPGQQGDVTDEQALDLLSKEAKKRREAIEAYQGAGRPELADKEQAELDVILRYLPEPLTEDEIATIVDEAIAATGAVGPSDMGKVMGAVTPRTKGRADGKMVSALVKDRLAAS